LLSLVALGPGARIASIVALALLLFGDTCRLRSRLRQHGREHFVDTLQARLASVVKPSSNARQDGGT